MTSPLHHPPLQTDGPREATVVRFAAPRVSLDELAGIAIRDRLYALAEEESPAPVRLDFSNVEFVSSLVLGTLVNLHRKLSAAGRRLTVFNVRPRVYEVFVLMRLNTLFDVRPAGASMEEPRQGQSLWIELPGKESERCSS